MLCGEQGIKKYNEKYEPQNILHAFISLFQNVYYYCTNGPIDTDRRTDTARSTLSRIYILYGVGNDELK